MPFGVFLVISCHIMLYGNMLDHIREQETNGEWVIQNSEELKLISITFSCPENFQEAEKFCLRKESRLKGPKSSLLALMKSITQHIQLSTYWN